ncbi:MAG: extracellular solute-binding protein [Planctomycetaceae bacterium]|nr:extracellular solute-binding protein [Planctomycetaceae bacterium]
MMAGSAFNRRITVFRFFLAAVSICSLSGCRPTSAGPDLVVYCSQDAVFAAEIIQRFEQQSGLKVSIRYDEESNKSLGLTNLLIAEKEHPRCDVFWNNQTLGTIRLQKADVLQPYISPNASRIPAQFRDPEGYWTGFAARLRVYLINTDQLPATEAAVTEVLNGDSLQRVAIAQPLFGTTLSHYAVLMAEWGDDKLKHWHQSLHQRGIQEVRGNSMSMNLVAEGICAVGFTDTDDAFVAIDAEKPVQMIPVRLESGQTICLPNTVAVIRNCQHREAAEKFVDFMLSAETELLMAQSASRQIPLGPVDEARLPPEVVELRHWAADGIDLREAASVHERVLDWLSAEYLQP